MGSVVTPRREAQKKHTLVRPTAVSRIIAANQAGNVSYDAAPQITLNITIEKAAQGITFGSHPGPVSFPPAGTFTVSATASSGLAAIPSAETSKLPEKAR